MKKIRCAASVSYDIVIGEGILSKSAEMIENAIGEKPRLAVITDDIVDSLHGAALDEALSGFDRVKFVFPNGESSKNIRTYEAILEFLCENSITRNDVIVAFGGGVCGDMAGFAAATYLRGIRFVQIPSTLLAMVDSSVGGKTAIDLAGGKNLCGAFWQPSLVICDPLLLKTLPADIFADGMAEVIKYGVMGDAELFAGLLEKSIPLGMEEMISRCISVKRDIVEKDERESGVRALLNFGHTAAHGIEKLSSYEISHGRAVGMGMIIAARASAGEGLCSFALAEKIEKAVKLWGLDTVCPYNASELSECAMRDKKRAGDKIKLILCKKEGECIIRSTLVSELCSFFEKGLEGGN